MSEVDAAYAEAERLIEDAREKGRLSLHLKNRALAALPQSIATLKELHHLELDNTQISDLSPLSGLVSLRTVSLNSTPVIDLAPLAGHAELSSLYLSQTRVSDLSPLSGLTRLSTLLLDQTSVSDLSALSGLRGLTDLSLNQTGVSDLSPLSRLPLLILSLNQTSVIDLKPLSGLTGLEELMLADTSVSDLTPLASLTDLISLGIEGTLVTDLSPLADLTGLVLLRIDRTPVTDLRPILALRKFGDPSSDSYMTFSGCAATRADPKIAEIAEFEDAKERTSMLFEYLEHWDPRELPDPLIPVTRDDNRLEIAASKPSEAEVEERLKQVLYQQMREKATDLARAAGNRFPKLAARARTLEIQLQPAFADTDILTLHLAVEDLRTLHLLGAEEQGEPFPEEVIIPLTDIVNRGPGVTLGNPDVDTLVRRANTRREAYPEPDAARRAQDAMSEAVARSELAFGDRLRSLEAQVLVSLSPEAKEVQRAANRNILWRITVTLLSDARSAAVGTIVLALGPSISAFLQANLPILVEAAAADGPSFQGWFLSVMSQYRDTAQILANLRAMRDP